jgi:hypothetical protein
VEAGVVRWIGKEQENVIPEVLALGEREAKKFNNMLSSARDARPLELRDVYTREQLEPMRTRGDAQLTDETRAELLDAVFKPLA